MHINKWVSEKTRGKIDQMVDPTSMPDDTVLAIVNAVYFRGKFMFVATWPYV